MKAWLTTWEWSGNAAAMADVVAAILNSRWGQQRVLDLVEALYALTNSTPGELAIYARRPSHNPYRARYEVDRIVCGHNPWLEARKVAELEIRIDETTDLETISWKEPDAYAIRDQRPTKIRDGARRIVRRRITGPLRPEAIWDRSRNSFKDGWGPKESPRAGELS